jgi:biopolymer transport protein ExbD/DNA-directed RNA polymerase subunit RPC12/RpoP
MIRFECTNCGKKFKSPEELAGRSVSCSACGTKLTIPSPAPAPQSAENTTEEEEHSAFTFDLPKRPVFEDLVDMTAMVDIVFFLLIFFMVTSMQGLYSAISIPAPNVEAATSQVKKTIADAENDSAIVRIDRDNTIYLDVDVIKSEQELRVRLKAIRQGEKGATPLKKLTILGSGDAHTVTVVKVIDAGNDAGMDEVRLALDNES